MQTLIQLINEARKLRQEMQELSKEPGKFRRSSSDWSKRVSLARCYAQLWSVYGMLSRVEQSFEIKGLVFSKRLKHVDRLLSHWTKKHGDEAASALTTYFQTAVPAAALALSRAKVDLVATQTINSVPLTEDVTTALQDESESVANWLEYFNPNHNYAGLHASQLISHSGWYGKGILEPSFSKFLTFPMALNSVAWLYRFSRHLPLHYRGFTAEFEYDLKKWLDSIPEAERPAAIASLRQTYHDLKQQAKQIETDYVGPYNQVALRVAEQFAQETSDPLALKKRMKDDLMIEYLGSKFGYCHYHPVQPILPSNYLGGPAGYHFYKRQPSGFCLFRFSGRPADPCKVPVLNWGDTDTYVAVPVEKPCLQDFLKVVESFTGHERAWHTVLGSTGCLHGHRWVNDAPNSLGQCAATPDLSKLPDNTLIWDPCRGWIKVSDF